MLFTLPALLLAFLSSSILVAQGGKRKLCLSNVGADDLDSIRECNILYGDIGIMGVDFNANFTPLSNLTELVGKLSMFANEGPPSLGHVFPNLAVLRVPQTHGKEVMAAIYISENTNFKLINLTKLAYLEGFLDITSEAVCHATTVYWEDIASSSEVANKIELQFRQLNSFDSCWDTCPLDCPVWLNGGQYCWSSSVCQRECKYKNSQGQRLYCRQDNPDLPCDPTCLGSCTGPTAADCVACKNLMVLDSGTCLLTNITICPIGTLDLNGKYCVSQSFCKEIDYRIYGATCIAVCPSETNDDPDDPYKCIVCSEDACKRIDRKSRTVMYAGDFPADSYTDMIGNLVLNLEGLPSSKMKERMPKFSSLRNLTGFLKIYRSERIQDLDVFEALQEIGSDGCSLSNGFCLTIHSNEFLQRLWTPKSGQLRILNGNISIAHNPRLCQSEIERFIEHVKLVAPNARVVQEGNGDRGYCGSIPIKPILVIDQVAERETRQSDSKQPSGSMWQVVPLVAFNLTNHDQLLTLFVYHQRISSPKVNLTYYDPAYCDGGNEWKRHVVQIANYSNPDHWRVIDGQKLVITNVSTPTRLNPNHDYAIYAMAQYLDGKIAISHIIKFKTITATPGWGSGQTVSVKSRTWNSLTMTWPEPVFPNGKVTHYIIRYGIDTIVPAVSTAANKCQLNRVVPTTTPAPRTTQPFDEDFVADGNNDENTWQRIRDIHEIILGTITKSPNAHPFNQHDDLEEELGSTKPLFVERHVKRSIPEFQNDGFEPEAPEPTIDLNELRTYASKQDEQDEFCSQLRSTIFNNDLLSRTVEMKSKLDVDPVIVCDTKTTLTNLMHFTSYKVEIKACHSPNLTTGQYLCSMSMSAGGFQLRTDARKDADKVYLDTITADPNTETKDGRVYRRIYVQRPNLTNGAVFAFEMRFRGVGSPDWMLKCIDYNDDDPTHPAIEVLLPVHDPKHELQVRVVTGHATDFSETFLFDGVVSDVPFIIALSIGLSISLLLISASLMTWYAFALRKKKKLLKARGAGTPDWISMNPDYPLLSAVDIPAHLELERDDIEVLAEIGHGTFGVVYRGIFKQPNGANNDKRSRCQVAIKSLRCDASHRQKHDFLHEALLMAGLDCHHVVRMIGVVSKTQPVYVVMELMENGDLKAYLVKQRIENSTIGPGIVLPAAGSSAAKLAMPGCLTVLDFSQMAGEIADGMAYLSARKIVHRDLAARNCLVARDRTVKIGDFGLARDVYDDGYYHLNGRGLLPIRWMAPESLKDGVFDTNSDVWAYGVLLWEIITYGEQPYQGKSNEEVLEAVKQHRQVLNKPKNCPDKFYNLMLRCWQYKPNERPSFVDIVRELLPCLRPDFLKLSYYGTLSPAEQLGTNNSSSNNSSKQQPSLGSEEDEESEEGKSLYDEEGENARAVLDNKEKAVANLYNHLVVNNGSNEVKTASTITNGHISVDNTNSTNISLKQRPKQQNDLSSAV